MVSLVVHSHGLSGVFECFQSKTRACYKEKEAGNRGGMGHIQREAKSRATPFQEKKHQNTSSRSKGVPIGGRGANWRIWVPRTSSYINSLRTINNNTPLELVVGVLAPEETHILLNRTTSSGSAIGLIVYNFDICAYL